VAPGQGGPWPASRTQPLRAGTPSRLLTVEQCQQFER